MKNVMQLYNYYFDSYKEKYDEEDLSEGNKKSGTPNSLKLMTKRIISQNWQNYEND